MTGHAAASVLVPLASRRRGAAPKRVRLGIVGCGAVTEAAHLPAALRSDRADLVALADANPGRLRHLQQQFELTASVTSDYRDLFDQVDAVVLALPNHLHRPIGLELLRRGIHVLCEKPLAPTYDECRELCEIARLNGAVLAVGYVTRFFPNAELLKQLLADGLLGQVIAFDYEFGAPAGWQTVSGYNLTRASAGGGVLLVDGSHFLDRLIDLFGMPQVVRCEDDRRGGVEANCRIWVTCQVQGRLVPGEITCSKTHRLANRLRIAGENGSLEVRAADPLSVVFRPGHGRWEQQISLPGSAPGDDYFRAELEDFVDAIQLGTEPRVNGEDGARSVALIETCYRMATRISEPWVDATLPRLDIGLTE